MSPQMFFALSYVPTVILVGIGIEKDNKTLIRLSYFTGAIAVISYIFFLMRIL